MTDIEFKRGQRVIVHSGPPDHGSFAGVVKEVDEIRVIVTPDDPALRLWFTTGYDVGRAHWGNAVVPHPGEGASGG